MSDNFDLRTEFEAWYIDMTGKEDVSEETAFYDLVDFIDWAFYRLDKLERRNEYLETLVAGKEDDV